MNVNLEKLSEELTAAGVKVLGRYHENTGGYLQVPVAAGSYLYVITDGSEPIDWTAIDIIRRHVAPVALDPGLRAAIARRMYADADAYAVSLGASPVAWEDCGGQQKWYYRRADSALAVLAERGMA